MTSGRARASCLDTSALLKLYVDEEGSDIIRNFAENEPARYTTPFCYYETLNMLKVKWLYRGEITEDEYLKKSFSLTAWFSHVARNVNDIDFKDPSVFLEVQTLAKDNSLDLSDAFQILSVMKEYFSPLTGDSSTILVTADKKLASVARSEGLKAWYFMKEPAP